MTKSLKLMYVSPCVKVFEPKSAAHPHPSNTLDKNIRKKKQKLTIEVATSIRTWKYLFQDVPNRKIRLEGWSGYNSPTYWALVGHCSPVHAFSTATVSTIPRNRVLVRFFAKKKKEYKWS